MTHLLLILAALLPAHVLCVRRARRRRAHLMRPAELWDCEDVDRWLGLIEPFPLGRSSPRNRAR